MVAEPLSAADLRLSRVSRATLLTGCAQAVLALTATCDTRALSPAGSPLAGVYQTGVCS